MKHATTPLITLFLISLMTSLLSNKPVWAETIREPAYAGSFYPAEPDELIHIIESLTQKAKQSAVKIPAAKTLKALIVPHAGYIYSGLTAAHAGHVLTEGQFLKVILMGPDHRVGFSHIALSSADAFKTPLGSIRIHGDAKKLRKNSNLFKSVPLSDRHEHSLEVVLPFLQYYLKDFKFIPMVMGPGDIDQYTGAIESVVDDQTLLVASSDLSHYLPYPEAVTTDKDTIDMIIRLDTTAFANKHHCACGKIPILILMKMARKHGWQPILIHYSNSGDTAGTRDKVVGYAAIAFYGDRPMKNKRDSNQHFSKEQGQLLVKLARQTIYKELGQDVQGSESLETALRSKEFQERRATFVTLNKSGQLRGCIGSLLGREPIVEGVRHNAINAAFHDPRFRPLSEEELDQIEIEISILSDPKPLEYHDGDDLIAKLRVNVDGVILRKGSASATFLPQVWKQLPNPKDFLSHLCRKAGLHADAWQKTRPEILTYQVEYFEEE